MWVPIFLVQLKFSESWVLPWSCTLRARRGRYQLPDLTRGKWVRDETLPTPTLSRWGVQNGTFLAPKESVTWRVT